MFEKVTIKYNAELREFVLADLDIANLENPTDNEIRQAVCHALNVGPNELDDYVVDTFDTVIQLRPNAVFGDEIV